MDTRDVELTVVTHRGDSLMIDSEGAQMPTKPELLRQIEELSRRVKEAEKETQELRGSGLLQKLGAICKSKLKLK